MVKLDKKTKSTLVKGNTKNSNIQMIRQDIDKNGLTLNEINELMKGYANDGFLGTIASNQIPLLVNKVMPKSRVSFVMNLSKSGTSGSHWVAIYIDGREDGDYSLEYYDSFCLKPSAKFMKDIKLIVNKIHAEGYLTFKVNKIRDQSFKSTTCGYFACKFLVLRYKNVPFSEASGYNKVSSLNEKNVEQWKKKIGIEPFLHLYSGMNGTGIIDFVKGFAKGLYNKVKLFLSGQRGHAGPYIREYLQQYGTNIIIGMKVCRKPVFSIIEHLASYLSNGVFDENKAKLGYDKMFHLFFVIKITDGKTIKTIKLEKNQTVVIANSEWNVEDSKGTEIMNIDVKPKLTLIDLFINGEKSAGSAENLFNYDPVTRNCQRFLKDCLNGSGMLTTELTNFIMQDVKKTLDKLGLLENLARGATELAGRFDHALYGSNPFKNKRKPMKGKGIENSSSLTDLSFLPSQLDLFTNPASAFKGIPRYKPQKK